MKRFCNRVRHRVVMTWVRFQLWWFMRQWTKKSRRVKQIMDQREDRFGELRAENERLRAIVDKLPKDAEGNVYPPPNALQGNAFYHPDHLGPGPRLFTQLFWYTTIECWGIGSGGWDVKLSECYLTREAAEAAKHVRSDDATNAND